MQGSMSLLADYLDSIDRFSAIEECLGIILAFRKGVLEEPEKLPRFFQSYGALIGRLMPDALPGVRDQITLQDIAGFAVLADNSSCGQETYGVMLTGPGLLAGFYDDTSRYGAAMRSLAQYIGLEGPLLGDFIFSESNFH